MLPDNTFNAITQRIPVLRDRLATEEATKQALVLPFLQALGYNVFDPTEVEPEYTADIGTKQGEKVDYAVMADGKPVILIECKKVSDTTLDRNVSQLLRYFGTTSAHIGVLTNGIVYQFFSDLESPNVMDTTPFLEINMEYLDSRIVEQLGQFAKGFDLEETVEAASRLRYVNGMKQALEQQYQQPEDDFVEWLGRRVYTGRMTQSVKEKFVSLTRRAIREFVNNHISDTLKAAQDLTYIPETLQEAVIEEGVRAAGEVVTTPLELAAYEIVKKIAGELVEPDRVTLRDVVSYCSITLDNNSRQPLCRLVFDRPQKQVGFFDGRKYDGGSLVATWTPIESVEELYNHADQIKETVQRYVGLANE